VSSRAASKSTRMLRNSLSWDPAIPPLSPKLTPLRTPDAEIFSGASSHSPTGRYDLFAAQCCLRSLAPNYLAS
jgi:hypothetical protein